MKKSQDWWPESYKTNTVLHFFMHQFWLLLPLVQTEYKTKEYDR
jgi:hypothetical protein